MLLSPRRLAFWMTVFAAVGIWLALPNPTPSMRTLAGPSPWIPLPASGMDASQASVRDLLSSLASDDLAATCGWRDAGIREHYRLLISRDVWGDHRQIDIVPQDDSLDISIRDGGFPPPPPPGTVGDDDDTRIVPVMHIRLARSAAEPLRRAWNTQRLWHAPQSEVHCLDGKPLRLEACVNGRFAARSRTCDVAAHSDREALWHGVDSLLPKPAPAHLR